MAKKSVAEMSISELQAELKKRQRVLPGLKKKADKLRKQLATLDAEIEMLEGAGKVTAKKAAKKAVKKTAKKAAKKAAKKVTRKVKKVAKKVAKKAKAAAGQPSLADALEGVLKSAGNPMKVGDLVDGVLKAGYKTKSKIFRTIVSQTLSRDKRFKTVKRGVYKV